MVTKKRPGNTQNKSNQNKKNQTSSAQKTTENSKPATNVRSINQETAIPAQDINHKLSSLEETLANLETRFYLSHDEFEQLFNGVNERSDISNSDIKELQAQLSKLNSGYQVLDTQSSRLVKETGRLALLIDKLNVDKLEAIGEFEQQLVERLEAVENKGAALDKSIKNNHQKQAKTLEALKTDILESQKTEFDKQSKSLDELRHQSETTQEQQKQALSDLSTSLKKEFKAYQKQVDKQLNQQQQQQIQNSLQQFQQLQHQLEESNRNNSAAQQFLDQKQQALIQQTESIAKDSKGLNQTISDLSGQLQQQTTQLEQELSQQKTQAATDNKALGNTITELAEKSHYEYQDLFKQYQLNAEQTKQLNVRQSELSETLDNLDKESQTALEKVQQSINQQTEDLQGTQEHIDKNAAEHQAQIDDLVQFDQKLALGAHHLEHRTDILEREEKLHQEKIAQLSQQSLASTELSKKNQRQVNYIINQEKGHFNLLSRGLLLLIIAIVVAGLYSYRHFQDMQQADYTAAEQNELQKLAIASNAKSSTQLQQALTQQQQTLNQQKAQISQQQNILTEDFQANYQQLQQQMQSMQALLQKQQQQIQAKDQTIQSLSQEIQDVDDNLQYLNNSVGPYMGYNRHAYQGKLQSPIWLQQQPVDNYIVQLLSVPNKQQLFQFIQRYGYYLTDKLAYLKMGEQYMLSYGSFAKQADAEQALDVLPGSVSRYNQGIRQIKDLTIKP